MSQSFIKNEEDFICEHCGFSVTGNGYTNHCPRCLWSKHVDINPGDRANACGGMMRPVEVQMVRGEFEIVHKCTRCHLTKRNKSSLNDNLDAVL